MRDRKFLYGVFCSAVLTLAGVATAQRTPDNANDIVKPLVVVPGSVPRYSGQQGREADITELLATSAQTGGRLGIFGRQSRPAVDRRRIYTKWRLGSDIIPTGWVAWFTFTNPKSASRDRSPLRTGPRLLTGSPVLP